MSKVNGVWGRARMVPAVVAAILSLTPVVWAQTPPAREVPRERTLIIASRSAGPDLQGVGVANPYMTGEFTNTGPHLINEPLFFLNTNANKVVPWLGTGFTYSADFKSVVLKLRTDATWSDGRPFSADDVAYTINLLAENGRGKKDLQQAVAVASVVEKATADSADQVTISFSQPAPRFVLEFLAWHFGRGLTMLPAHIFRGVSDPATYTFFDIGKGLPISTGAYRLSRWSTSEITLDRRDDWWGAKSGFAKLPQVERVIVVPFVSNDRSAQLVVSDQIDVNRGHTTALVKKLLDENPRLTTYSGRNSPYGNIDWWPTSLFFNNKAAPFDDVRVRKAVGLAINRAQVIAIAHGGASQATVSPFPDFGTLRPFIAATADLATKNEAGTFDLKKSAELMEQAGFTKGRDGLWARQGQKLSAEIHSIADMASVGNVVAEQLRRAGFDTTFVAASDSIARIRDGRAQLILWGHHGSTFDAFATLDSYTCKHARPIGEAAFPFFSRWCNPAYDELVAQIGRMSPSDPAVLTTGRQAMEIWYRETPEIPIAEWYHQIPLNGTYWKNWPSAENAYAQPAPWLTTGPLILHNLQPVR